MRNFLAITVLSLCMSAASWAQVPAQIQVQPVQVDPDQNKPRQIQVQVEFIEMPHELYTQLQLENKPDGDATPLRKKVQELVKNQKALILETMLSVARSGMRTVTDSADESVFFDKDPAKEQKSDQAGTPSEKTETPTRRHSGSSLVIEPTLSDSNKIIDLRFIPSLSWVAPESVVSKKSALEDQSKGEWVRVFNLKTNCSITLIDGEYALAAVLTPQDDKGKLDTTRKVMLFVKADVLVLRD